jgi:hypothetical protein
MAPTTKLTQLLGTLFEAWDLVVAELEEAEPLEPVELLEPLDDGLWLELTTPPCTTAGAVLVAVFLAAFM